MADIDLTLLPPEERDLILQLGQISRPFGTLLEADKPKANILARAYYALTGAAEWEVYGVDISYWQGKIDFAVLATMAKFVVVRAGYGNDFFDPNADQYIQGCADYNLPWGIYWYLKPGKDWRKHADSFSRYWRDKGGYIYPTSDLEENGGLIKTELDSWCSKFYIRFSELVGLPLDKLMTYSSANFFNTYLPLSDLYWRTNLDVAHWTTAPQPTLPLEWSNHKKEWLFWQHTSKGDGHKHGAESLNIDLQRFNGNAARFKLLFGADIPQDPPPPVPPFVKINVAELNVRTVASDALTTTVIAKTTYGKVWKTTGVVADDANGRGRWYQVSDEHGQTLWLAGWLCVPA